MQVSHNSKNINKITFRQSIAERLGHTWKIVKESPRTASRVTLLALYVIKKIFVDTFKGSVSFSSLMLSLKWLPYSEDFLGYSSIGSVYEDRLKPLKRHKSVQLEKVSNPKQHGMSNSGTNCFIISVLQSMLACQNLTDNLGAVALTQFKNESKELFEIRKSAKAKLTSILSQSKKGNVSEKEIDQFRKFLYNYEYKKRIGSIEKQAVTNIKNKKRANTKKNKAAEIQRLLNAQLPITQKRQQDAQEFYSYLLHFFQLDDSHHFLKKETLNDKNPQYSREQIDSIHINPLYKRIRPVEKTKIKNHLTSFLTEDRQRLNPKASKSPIVESVRGLYSDSLDDSELEKNLPKIIPIHVVRYTDKGRKIHPILPFSETMQVPLFKAESIVSDSKFEGFSDVQETGRKISYHLQAVIINVGTSLSSSHYMTYIKENSDWLLHDDKSVKKCKNAKDAIRDIEVNGCIYFYAKEKTK